MKRLLPPFLAATRERLAIDASRTVAVVIKWKQ